MTYEEASESGFPFNRSVYKDGWYLNDPYSDYDRSLTDLSIRIWSKEDLEANDWEINYVK